MKWVVKKALKDKIGQLPVEIGKRKEGIQQLADQIGDFKYGLMIYDLLREHTNTRKGWRDIEAFLPSSGTDKEAVLKEIRSTKKKVLFCLPGLFSTVEKGFEEFLDNTFVRNQLAANHCRYIVGANMPTVLHGIEKNATAIADLLKSHGIKGKPCNVIARSRGGLVARHLFELDWHKKPKGEVPFVLKKMIMTGTPNEGTKIASTEHWRSLFNIVINVAKFTVGLALPVVPQILTAIKAVGLGVTELDGINDQEEGSDIIVKLNNSVCDDRKNYHVFTSNFEPQKGWFKRLFDERIVDRVIFEREHNDSVTPVNGAMLRNDQFKKVATLIEDQCYFYEPVENVSHFSYLNPERHPEIVKEVLRILG